MLTGFFSSSLGRERERLARPAPAYLFHLAAFFAAISVLAPVARADTAPANLGTTSLDIKLADGYQPPQSADKDKDAGQDSKESSAHPAYGLAGAQCWTLGGLYANDFKGDNDFNIHADYSYFLADDLEFAVEIAAWYFNQEGTDTGGISGSMVFRWHFAHDQDRTWTVFADAGVGILGAFDEVPDGGTGFDFLPRLGAGFTKALTDDAAHGPRLMVGVRWHHISNARIEGDHNNPARDSLAVYAALVFPF